MTWPVADVTALKSKNLSSLYLKCLLAGNHYERKRMGQVVGNMPWASVTRKACVRTTLWYERSPGRRRKWHHDNSLSPAPDQTPQRTTILLTQNATRSTQGFQISEPSLGMLPRLKTPFSSGEAVKEGRKAPMVLKVAQQAEHYAFRNSKCSWQAGWLLAGEGLSARLIQTWNTLLTSAVEQQTIQHPCSPWAARRDSPSHKINKVHAVFT